MSSFAERLEQAEPVAPLLNPEAELSLLSDLIADNRLIDSAADFVRPVDFGVDLYGRVFAQMLGMAAAKQAVDAVTLLPHFKDDEDWRATKLYGRLAAADLNAGPASRTKAYAEQIRDLAARRRLVLGLQEVIQDARTLNVDQHVLIANADDALSELADQGASDEQAPAGVYAQAVIDSFGKPIVGVRSGLIGSLDDLTTPIRPSNFVVLGGRPGMGKTSLVSSYALGVALQGMGVLLFSLEMKGDELLRRMLADLCCTVDGGVQFSAIRAGTVRGDDLQRVMDAKRKLDAMSLEIVEKSGLTIHQLVRRTRRHKRRLHAQGRKLHLVIVDYLQLMGHSRPRMSLYEHVTEVSMGLKNLAKDEDVVVIAVAQLSRDVEKRPDKRPVPSDLRDSGQIEQDADTIIFVYREEEYLKHQEPDEFSPKYAAWRTDMDAVRNKIEFLVPKNRHAPSGRAMGFFFGQYSAVRGDDFYRLGNGGGYGG